MNKIAKLNAFEKKFHIKKTGLNATGSHRRVHLALLDPLIGPCLDEGFFHVHSSWSAELKLASFGKKELAVIIYF